MATCMRALCLAMMAMSTMATSASAKTQVFPSLRKRKEQQQLAAAQMELPSPAEEDSSSVGPVQAGVSAGVPAAVDMGADGFPQLPAVSQILSGASGTLKTVSNQASSLQARVVQAQMQSESKLAKQKAAFEEKLKQQEEKNQLVIKANSNISAAIKGLQGSNTDLKKHAHEVEQNNHVMRSELRELSSRLGSAEDFTAKSLTKTDDSKNAMLQVLGGHHKKSSRAVSQSASKAHKGENDEDDDEDDSEEDDSDDKNSTSVDKEDDEDDDDDKDEDSDESGTSLLSLMSSVHRVANHQEQHATALSSFDVDASKSLMDLETTAPASPAANTGDLLGDLMRDVAHLADQEKQSEKTLKALFIRDFRAGAKRQKALLAQQKDLMSTRDSLLALQAKLKTALAHLDATHTHLQGRLHGIGHFLQQLAHLAMAPQQDVKQLSVALPKVVTAQ